MTPDGATFSAQQTTAPAFQLRDANGSLLTQGVHGHLPRGAIHDLPQRVADFFAAHRSGPALLTGALPYDRDQQDFLTQPLHAQHYPELPVANDSHSQFGAVVEPTRQWQITEEPSSQAYAASVSQALELLNQPLLSAERKIVLARSLLVDAGRQIDPLMLLRRLALDTSVTAFMAALPAAPDGGKAMLVGATPELLLKKTGDRVLSHPLAGSASRHAQAADDENAAAQLLRSEKDLREHRNVVEAILDTLAPYCKVLNAPVTPSLRSTATMWHLGTRIDGILRSPETSCAELLRDLHPTPAVCGTPREWAREMIAHLENIDRGFFAGAVGWTDAQGDGTWYVAIRCAELRGTQARLFAGAGIVKGSDPAQETAETGAKFGAMLRALQLER